MLFNPYYNLTCKLIVLIIKVNCATLLIFPLQVHADDLCSCMYALIMNGHRVNLLLNNIKNV